MRRLFKTALRNESGSLLMLALIILGIVALSAIYLTIILLAEIKNTRFADNALVGYYVAESGAEDALWRLKYAKNPSGPGVAFFTAHAGDTLCAAETGIGADPETDCRATVPATNSDPERYFDYKTLSTSAANFEVYDIPQNSPVFVDIFDPAAEGVIALPGSDASQLNVDWYVESCSGTEGSANLEITYTPVRNEDIFLWPPVTTIDVCGCNPSNPDTVTGYFRCDPGVSHSAEIGLSQLNEFYRVVIRSLDVSVKKLTVTTDDATFPSQIEVAASGFFRESRSSVTLRASWRDALSGIFNYVVFSEESLIKDTPTDESSAYAPMCGFCTNSAQPKACASIADCDASAGQTCTILNDIDDLVDGASSVAFCTDGAPEANTDGSPISQTNANLCNAFCNGITFCGDSTVQTPNGSGAGGPLNGGIEECDEGPINSDSSKDVCRLNCINPYCGDGVDDDRTGPGGSDVEECDDGLGNLATDQCDTENALGGGTCRMTYCGDGLIQNPNGGGTSGATGIGDELCDGADLGGYGCTTIGQGFTGGVLGCLPTCAFDMSACT